MREIKHLSVHQWLRSAIPDSQQPTSPIGFLFLKLPPPPCAVLLVGIKDQMKTLGSNQDLWHACRSFNWAARNQPHAGTTIPSSPSAKGQASKATLCPFEFLKWIRKQPGALSSSLSLVADFPWDFQDGA